MAFVACRCKLAKGGHEVGAWSNVIHEKKQLKLCEGKQYRRGSRSQLCMETDLALWAKLELDLGCHWTRLEGQIGPVKKIWASKKARIGLKIT